ncbi:MAG TPA: hypothetical protein VHN55_07225 [Sphingomicrobium sp.]|nr:hypothetical protein [Sphingomicrobium sp.]
MAPYLFRFLLIAITLYAFLRGGREERAVALLCVIGAAATHAVISPLHDRFEEVESAVLLVDLALLAGFVAIALRSERFWPLWMAGIQLTTVMGHAMKQIESDLLPRAYAASLGFWAYWTLAILAVAVWRTQRRRLQADSPPLH